MALDRKLSGQEFQILAVKTYLSFAHLIAPLIGYLSKTLTVP